MNDIVAGMLWGVAVLACIFGLAGVMADVPRRQSLPCFAVALALGSIAYFLTSKVSP